MHAHQERKRREQAAARYRPERVDLLLVAEAPPGSLDRYFYFEDVREQDALFRYVARGVLGEQPTRENKRELLVKVKEQGVFLIDLKTDPVDGSPLGQYVPDLIARCRELNPRVIILIKATVYDAAYWPLKKAGLPVIDERIPFPGSGQQKNLEKTFSRALEAARA